LAQQLDRPGTPSAQGVEGPKDRRSARAPARPKAPAQALPKVTEQAQQTAREPASSSDELTGSASSALPSDGPDKLSAPDAAELMALMSARVQGWPKAPAPALPMVTEQAQQTAQEPASSSDELTDSVLSARPSDRLGTPSAQGVEGQTVRMSARAQE
jgi:hypothetical protein